MISPNELRPLVPYLPDCEIPDDGIGRLQALDPKVPRAIGAEIIQKMLLFHQSTNSITRAYAGRLNRAHEIMSRPTERSYASLWEITMKLLQKDNPEDITNCMLWAVHKTLTENAHIRMNKETHRLYPMWDIKSKEDAKSMEKVREWMREYNETLVNEGTRPLEPSYSASGIRRQKNPFPGFFEVARSAIQESRRTRIVTQSGSIGPSLVRVKPTEPRVAVWKEPRSIYFTKDELMIIHFLVAWGNSNSLVDSPSFVSTAAMIVRATGMYEGFSLDRSTSNVLLQELGIIPPWFNRASLHPDLPLPFLHVNPLSDRLYIQAQESVAGFLLEDSMQGFRRDWGDLEAFCIDDACAQEIDDGISLEEIDGSSSTFWVHIHVANPSAFLGPDSAMGKYAAHLTASILYPESKYPLFPREITQKHFSLGKNRPCITFSAKMNTAGEIVDTQISHGILRNVTYITPDALKFELEPDKELGYREVKFTVGGELPSNSIKLEYPPLTTTQRSTLRMLSELGLARRRKRYREGAVFMNTWIVEPQVEVYLGLVNNPETQTHPFHERGHRYEDDPIICFNHRLPLETKQSAGISSYEVVADMMLLAGEVGALWCSKRNIPIPYRGTSPRPDPPETPDDFKRRVIDPAMKNDGFAPVEDVRHYANLLGRTVLSARPLEHKALGIEAYSRLTSPLRRYVDLMSHWQIEAAIRHESQTGVSLIGSTDYSYLAIPRSEVRLMIQYLSAREFTASISSRWAARLWASQLLFRALHFKEAPLPDTFQVKCIKRHHYEDAGVGVLEEFRMTSLMLENPVTQQQGGVRVGDCWEVKLTDVDCYRATTTVEPFRLVERPDIQQP